MDFPLGSGFNIVIAGDLMLDRYISGRILGESPEADVPVLDELKSEIRLGGAGNVALNIKSLRCQPLMIGITGNDEWSDKVIELMVQRGLITQFLIRDHMRLTTIKTRYYGDNRQLLRIDRESRNDIGSKLQGKLIENYKEAIRSLKIHGLIIQDYNKGTLTEGTIEELLKISAQEEIKVFVDPKFNYFFKYQSVFLLKPNLRETQTAIGKRISPNREDLNAVFEKLKQSLDINNLVITMGKEGIYFASAGDQGIQPAFEVIRPDVCGAGDTVISVLTISLLSGLNLRVSCRLAAIAGQLVCSKFGANPVLLEELKRFWSSLNSDIP